MSEDAMTTPTPELCPRKKCGEFNMLKCVRQRGHDGECCFVVDHENDYPHNKKPKKERTP